MVRVWGVGLDWEGGLKEAEYSMRGTIHKEKNKLLKIKKFLFFSKPIVCANQTTQEEI